MMQMQQQWLAPGWGRALGWDVLGGVRRRRTVDAWEDMYMYRTPTPLAPARGPPGSPPPAGRAAPSCLPSRGCRRSCGQPRGQSVRLRAFACVQRACTQLLPSQLTRSPWRLLLLLLLALGGGGGDGAAAAAAATAACGCQGVPPPSALGTPPQPLPPSQQLLRPPDPGVGLPGWWGLHVRPSVRVKREWMRMCLHIITPVHRPCV